jgi:3-hydroxybutyrate dehydrogenase
MGIKNRNAVITGSTSGIGLTCARVLAAEAVNVLIHGLGKAEDIEKERAAIANRHGVKAIYSPADMTKPDQIADMLGQAERELDGVDILINNAGIQFVSRSKSSRSRNGTLAINRSAAFDAIRVALPVMKAAGGGRIISTASAHSLVASPFKAAYVAAKHDLAGLTKTAALELATRNITVNCISPGYVWTPLVEHQIPDTMNARGLTRERVINDLLLDSQPTKEFVTAEQAAAIAVFLCSDTAAQITGANISVDGGWTAE